MNIVIDPQTFNETNIFFLDKKKNNIIDGHFSKIIYSSDLFIMNGVFILLPIVIKSSSERTTNVDIESGELWDERTNAVCNPKPIDDVYKPNRHIIYFYTHHLVNLQYITILSDIECDIINMYKQINGIKKNNHMGLSNQLHKGCFKIYKAITSGLALPKKYMVKISGVWENATDVGITYKFLEVFSEDAV